MASVRGAPRTQEAGPGAAPEPHGPAAFLTPAQAASSQRTAVSTGLRPPLRPAPGGMIGGAKLGEAEAHAWSMIRVR